MAGPRKPAKIRHLEGNRSQTPIPREIEPQGRPRCPGHLTEAEQARWKDIVASLPVEVLTRADEQVIERMAVAWTAYREACEALRKTGGTLVDRQFGNVVRNPLLIVKKQTVEEMNSCGMQLGLSPAARTRIAAPPEVDDDPLAVLLGPQGKAWSDENRKFDN